MKGIGEFLKNQNAKDLLRLFPILRPYWLRALEAACCTLFGTALALPMPLLSIYVIDQIVATRTIHSLHVLCAGLSVVTVAGLGLGFLQRYLLLVFSRRVFFDLEILLFKKVQTLPLRILNKFGSGYIATRISDDVRQLGSLMAGTYIELVSNLALLTAGVAIMILINSKLALVVLVVLPLFVFVNLRFAHLMRIRSEVVQEKKGLANEARFEAIEGAHVARAFGRGKIETKKILGEIKRELNASLERDVTVVASHALNSGLYSMGSLLLVWYGAYEITQQRLSVGQFIAFNTLLAYVYGPIAQFSSVYVTLGQGLGVLRRVIAFMDLDSEPTAGLPADNLPCGPLYFENVQFEYELGSPVLKSLNLRLEPGTITAIVGSTGSGKTTLINLILRFYEPKAGRVALDGVDIRDFDIRRFRQIVGLVSQNTLLFSGTIRDNIAYGLSGASTNEVWDAADAMNCTEFLTRFPLGLETRIGTGGVQLSGGQKQRVALARAVIRNPKILVLDEATSSLDQGSEKTVQDALKKAAQGRTTLLIDHHLPTIMMADHIAVLENGCIVEEGSLDVLLKRDTGYFAKNYPQERRELVA